LVHQITQAALWGGDVWLFEGATVSRVKLATDKSKSTILSNASYARVVGAAVSTCAPSEPVVK